ncbi:ABC transporter substrate-binding protein [Nitrospirillum iridis]|uniref:Peptide/nickel transport system substrate-binding protein n=1 Tax=Nitrospirillum iridis TaxID=765888 RepID=A0A7X0B528_9PROT|nr:ABC transporter substrate-binding protein [Nitrospirillum iridis]MBB6255146.1 peptide/nickel transport system substrate-binding protein [Nitrospirillum iridis]
MTARATTSLITRRHLMGGMLAAGLTAGGPAFGAGQEPALPQRGGRIRVAGMSSSTADTLDPAKGALSTDYARHYMFYSGLTRYRADLSAEPALAETLESDDRILWRAVLRTGVTFHDGKPLSPPDVVYSLMRHQDPATASKVRTIADQFRRVTVSGSNEVTIELTGPNADLPAILADSHFLIVQDGTADFRQAIGTGPYRCTSFQPGIATIAARNENYWVEGRPYLDGIELLGIPDEVSRVNALLSGDVHLVNAVNPRSARRIEASLGHRVLETKSGLYTNLIMRQDALPTRDPDFVLAMKFLFNRELVRRTLYRNYATIANDQPIPPGSPYYLADLPQRPYDPDRAGFHLRKAGLAGARLPVYASPAADGSVDMASMLQEFAAQAGLHLAVNRVPADGYWSTHWMKHPLGFGNTNPRPTADMLFSLFYKSDAPWNESGWRNEQFDQLLLAARGERDEARRRQMYGDMQVLVHDHCGVGIPVFISSLDGYDQRLKGLGSIPIGGLMGYSFAEHVWWEG